MDVIMMLGLVATIFVVVLMLFVSKYLLISQPNEVIVLSGRTRTLADGHTVGYRIIRGGRALRIPLVEKAARLSLETIPLELSTHNAYSKGGIPLKVEAIANVKIDSNEPTLGNAVERFLGKPHSEIHEIAKDTLEGNLRGVLATLTPEEVNDDRLKFAGTLVEEADQDLRALGLQLDTLKIQNVSDDVGYLDSIGRRKTAEVISAARKAEAERTAEAEEAEASGQRRAEAARIAARRDVETARAAAEQEVAVAANQLRVKQAELEKAAVIKEKEAEVAGKQAEAKFEQELELERIELQKRRLSADVLEPARAAREAAELEAVGAAASVREDGRARVEVLEKMIAAYRSADGDGERVFVLHMLPEILEQLTGAVEKVTIDKVSVIDSGGSNGNGHGVARVVTQLPGAVISLAEQIENATGVDLLSSLGRRAPAPAAASDRPAPEKSLAPPPPPAGGNGNQGREPGVSAA